MISLFRDRTPINFLAVLILGFLLKMPLFFYAKNIDAAHNTTGIYRYIISLFSSSSQPALFSSITAFLLLMIQAFLLNYLMNEYRMITKQTYLPAMAYLVITSLVPEWNFLSAPLIANTLIIWCFIILYRLYNLQDSKGKIYNIGLILGISSYLYFPSAAFALCMLMGILILKPFRLNEIILFLLGALTPYYFHAAYLLLTDSFTLQNFVPKISVSVPEVKSSIYLGISTLLLAVPFLIGGFYIQSQLHRILIQVRKNWSILLLYLLLAFFVPFLNSDDSFSNWILLAAPFAAFHASAYHYPVKKLFILFIFLASMGYIIFQQYGTDLWR